MDYALYLRAIVSLAFVLALMAGCLWIVKRFNLGMTGIAPRGRARRLALVETLALDARRRLVIVRRDNLEHLILLGLGGETIVETCLPVAPDTSMVEVGT